MRGCEYLTVVNRKIKMVQCMVCGTVDDVFERVAGNHIRVMNLSYDERNVSGMGKWAHTNILQKLTNTKRTKYKSRWMGNRNMKRWYGTDCR